MTKDVTDKNVTDNVVSEDKDAQMAELKAQVLALEKWKQEVMARDFQHRRNTAPTGTPLSGVLGPTAQLAIDRASRGPDRDQLDLINVVGISRSKG
jgi:hypothetical protein